MYVLSFAINFRQSLFEIFLVSDKENCEDLLHTLYNVLYTVQYIVHILHCAYIVQCTLQCRVHILHCTYIVQCTVHCTVLHFSYIVQYTPQSTYYIVLFTFFMYFRRYMNGSTDGGFLFAR